MGDEHGRSRRLVAVLALESSDGAPAFVRFAGRFLANGSHPAKMRQSHVQRPSARNAQGRRRPAVAAAGTSQRCMRMASPRRVGRIPAGFRRPSDGKHVGSRIVHPKIPDLAAAARRLAASQRTHPHIYRSDRTPGPVCACAARREGPSHADIEIALRCRPRTPATPQLGGEAAPIQIIA